MKEALFRTVAEVPHYKWKTGYTHKNIFMGSCFTENVGNQMAILKYNVDINPFGILYNPVSVANGLRFLVEQKEFTAEDLIQTDGLWHSFYHHSRFSGTSAEETLDLINSRIKLSAAMLREAGFLFITFGTSWVYQYKKTGLAVSNCHKIQASEFERYRLTVNEIVDDYRLLFAELKRINPNLKVVFTVSPIRHWKDGPVENQRSKAILILAIDELTKETEDGFCDYFPAYEIMMDELRDYRFYAEDMLHISDTAVRYIWDKFQLALIDSESRQIAGQVQKIINATNHRPLFVNSPEYRRFVKQMTEEIEQLENKYRFLDLKTEKAYFTAEFLKTNG